MQINAAQPDNEMNRLLELSELDPDYTALQDDFKGLARLAAGVARTEASLISLIDAFTQWPISGYGTVPGPMPREESVCTYALDAGDHFEVKDLAADPRFADKHYVRGKPALRYYFGIPLQTPAGNCLGTLCVFDTKEGKDISNEQNALLHIIAGEIINRLLSMKTAKDLRKGLYGAEETRKKLAHDIRGPLGGIIGLANIISQQGNANKMEDVLEFIGLIQKSGRSLLDQAETTLKTGKKEQQPQTEQQIPDRYTLAVFGNKLHQLFQSQAASRDLDFSVGVNQDNDKTMFPANKLLQVTGNLVAGTMKSTPSGGMVALDLDLQPGKLENTLLMTITSTATESRAPADITDVSQNDPGLLLVRQLVDSMKGSIDIQPEPGGLNKLTVRWPLKRM